MGGCAGGAREGRACLPAARLLRMPPDTIVRCEVALQEGNWARQAPPPGAAGGLPRPSSAADAFTHGGWDAPAVERLLTGDATPLRGEATPYTPVCSVKADTLLQELGVGGLAGLGAPAGDCCPADGDAAAARDTAAALHVVGHCPVVEAGSDVVFESVATPTAQPKEQLEASKLQEGIPAVEPERVLEETVGVCTAVDVEVGSELEFDAWKRLVSGFTVDGHPVGVPARSPPC
ncbi:unnamed protein product [Prorocentrum cordatum]|uniref:Uncharacterized protein n=1 Tax=Prorocentrum cordatum TaxID=2364126 RepID=A0ABN9U4Y0_9DINO|nr:unnamed protein product [Polarella glacialis]